jgi:hypothetical protein
MSIRSQLENMNAAIVENQGGVACPVTIDNLSGHVWNGSGLYFHFEQSVNPGVGMPVMELQDSVTVRITSVKPFFGKDPQQRWKVTAVDMAGNTIVGYINDCSPDFDLGRYILRISSP